MNWSDAILAQYGLAGVVIAALTVAVVYLYKKNDRLQAEKEALLKQNVEDLKEINRTFGTNIEKQTIINEKIYDFLITNKRSD